MSTRLIALASLMVSVGIMGTASAMVILPKEGSEINYTHVQFRWKPLPQFIGAPGELYQLYVVEDNGQPNPFTGNPWVINQAVASPNSRFTVVENLEWGKSYAWRVRGFQYDPLPWGPTHRFTIAELPEWYPSLTATTAEGATLEPGVTAFALNGGVVPGSTILYTAVDEDGVPVWFVSWPRGSGDLRHTGPDFRQLENGRFLWSGEGRGWEGTLNGGIVWASPMPTQTDPQNYPHEYENKVHHEIYPMPNGNRLADTYVWQDVFRDNQWQRWRSDKFVEYDYRTNDIVWEWNIFDYLDPQDFDEDVMSSPGPNGDYNWTHTNAMIYNEADNSVYISVRHLSRIVRIDYATGNIVYQMGFDMPSGDTDFGDNLFSFQHAPEMLPNGHMLVYDNGNRRDHIIQTPETGVTKAIELAFTGNPPTSAQIVWEFTLPEYCHFVGDVDRQPGGNTLVGMGGTSSGENRSILEVDPAGQELWRVTDSGGATIYRAERIASLFVDTPGDGDGDWDLDTLDYGYLQTCFTGPGPADLQFPCTQFDMDEDDDVDLDDYTEFVRTSTGPAA